MLTKHKPAEILADPNLWPQRPFMAVKRQVGSKTEHGVMADMDGQRLRIFDTNLFKLNKTPGDTYEEKLNNLNFLEYDSAANIVADGWEINA